MIDGIIISIIVVVLFLAIRYIVKEKAKGKCIGCPYSGSCMKKGNCGTSGDTSTTKNE